jgi:hypothetical protein
MMSEQIAEALAFVRSDKASDVFDSFFRVAEAARPCVVRDWLEYEEHYRQPMASCWDAEVGGGEFEADSPADAMAEAMFSEGWYVALRRVAQMLGLDPKQFCHLVMDYGEFGRDDLPVSLLQAMARGEITGEEADAETWPVSPLESFTGSPHKPQPGP